MKDAYESHLMEIIAFDNWNIICDSGDNNTPFPLGSTASTVNSGTDE